MCLIAIAWKTRPDLPLVLIANRDEVHTRPTAAAGPDPDAPDVHGGRDLDRGGSWLQATSRRRLAAVTNVRDGLSAETAPRSRGWLVRDFVRGDATARDFAAALEADAPEYGRFNLLLWDGDALWFVGNHPRFDTWAVTPGFHAMSNGAFDAPWPKSTSATHTLQRWIEDRRATADIEGSAHGAIDARLAPLFTGLRDTRPAPDAALPDTGVGLALERRLSPPFIEDPVYGTRCSSVVLASARDILFAERRFAAAGRPDGASLTRLPTG